IGGCRWASRPAPSAPTPRRERVDEFGKQLLFALFDLHALGPPPLVPLLLYRLCHPGPQIIRLHGGKLPPTNSESVDTPLTVGFVVLDWHRHLAELSGVLRRQSDASQSELLIRILDAQLPQVLVYPSRDLTQSIRRNRRLLVGRNVQARWIEVTDPQHTQRL